VPPTIRAAAGIAALVLLVSCQAGSCQAGAQPSVDLTAAELHGAWELTVTVVGNTGPPSQTARAVGNKGVDKVVFQSACPTKGHCALEMWGPSGPNSQEAAYYQYFGTTTGLQGPPVSIPMMQSVDTYSADIPISGFGGQVPCQPPRDIPAPNQRLTLRITNATHVSTGWLATTLVGSETLVGGWGCNGTVPSDWVLTQLGIAGQISQTL
jgi:hypothetical protein